MHRSEQHRVIRGLLAHLENGSNVDAGGQVRNPVTSYTCPEMARNEWRLFFQQYPQVMGLSGDLPEPGAFITSRALGKPMLLTRDEQGRFHAFLNVCRHRGTMVENARRGAKRQFNCPFHGWGYSARGELTAVPKESQFGPVDRNCHGLIELPAEERYGLLWLHPDPNAILDIDDCLGSDLAAELNSWQLARHRYQSETTYPHAMNWKLAIDTFGETYHFNTLHRDTLAQSFYGNVQLYDTYQRNHRMMLCLKSIDQLRTQPPEQWNVLFGALPVYYLYPNVQLIIGLSGPTLVRVYPEHEDPNDSHSEISFYLDPRIDQMALDPRFEEDAQDAEARALGFAEIIQREDYVAAASSHVGALSGAQRYITFGRNEPALHHYHNTYRAALGLPPLERISS